MTDYGHTLKFGTVLVPLAASPAQLVTQSRLADAEGLDLLAAIDHPYRPDFVDALTLLTILAGQTSQITVMPDVACLPLRPPAMLAKSIASLALLSDGRAALGLGAGGLWAEIASLGGPVRSPGEALAALSEAIDVFRAFAGTGTTDYRGGFYQLNGASPGPHPQADIPLWIGGYRPKMLKLIGEKGDGWVFSDMFLPPTNIAEGNWRIDEAASAAGRNPADIRRLYNISGSFQSGTARDGFLQGPATVWAEQLAELVLSDGVSGFILAPRDDPAEQLRMFAREVAPAVREAVSKARADASGQRLSCPA